MPAAAPPVAPPPASVHQAVDSVQVNSLRGNIGQLQLLMVADRATLTGFIQNGNIVYRNQQAAALVALNNPMRQREAAVLALVARAGNLRAGFTTEATYNTLRADYRTEAGRQRQQRRALAAHAAAHPRNPNLNIGAGALAAGAVGIVAQMRRWANGQDGALANTVNELPPFADHPRDPRWEVRVPAIPNWAGADPQNGAVLGNGSIPTTAHGAHALPNARGQLIAALTLAGYT